MYSDENDIRLRTTFRDAVRIFPTNAQRKEFNVAALKQLKTPLCKIEATHNHSKAKRFSADEEGM